MIVTYGNIDSNHLFLIEVLDMLPEDVLDALISHEGGEVINTYDY